MDNGIKLALVVSTPEVGAWPYALLTGDFEQKLKKARRLGYDGVELLMRDPARFDWAAARATIARHGLEVPALVTGALSGLDGLGFAHRSPQVRRAARQRLKALIDCAADYGAIVDVGLLRGKLAWMNDPADAEREMQAAFLDVAGYAAERGVRLTVECLNRYEADCINNADQGLAFLDRLGHPAVGLLLDTFHMNIEEASFGDSIRRAGGRLWHVHVGDSNRLAPGQGHIPFAEIVGALRQIGYRGYLSVEVLAGPDPDRTAQLAVEHLRQHTTGHNPSSRE